MDNRIKISEVFSKTPGPGRIEEGNYSGQLFREKYLAPMIEWFMGSESKVVVDLDGTAGYGASFLVHAFGGLIGIDKFEISEVLKMIEIISEEEDYLKGDVIQYIKEGDNIQYAKEGN